MGKFRSKPTRAVAKPFKRKAAPKASPSMDTTRGREIIIATVDPSKSKISKRSTKSSLKKKASAAALQDSPKKSVTFSNTNVTHIYTAKKECVKDILKQGAGALVNLVADGARKLLQNKKNPSTPALASAQGIISSNSLNKVLRHEFKDKKTRRRLRKEAFKKKLSLIKASEEELKAEKRRKQMVIVGDLQPIAKILEELEEENSKKSVVVVLNPKQKPTSKKRGLKKREEEFMDALKIFETAGL